MFSLTARDMQRLSHLTGLPFPGRMIASRCLMVLVLRGRFVGHLRGRLDRSFCMNELSQSLVQGAHHQTLYTTSRFGASESSEMQQLRQERDSLTAHRRILETNVSCCSQSVLLERKLRRFFE